MKKLDSRRLIEAYLLLVFLFLLDVRVNICLQQSGKVYIYAFPKSPSSEILFGYFYNKSDWKVTFHSVNDSSYSDRFLKIVKTFRVLDMKILPAELCLPCIQNLTSDEILIVYASPLVAFFRNERLTAITVGIIDYRTLDQALLVNANYVKVFTRYDVYTLTDEGVKAQLEEILVGQEESGNVEVNVSNFASSIVFLALADSVNPCTFAVFTALLLIALHSFGKMKAATIGFSFILAIFIGYYALGLGIFQILATIPIYIRIYINRALALAGLAIGVSSVISGLKPTFKSQIPKSVRKSMQLWISKSYASPMASFALGLVAAFALLPCSSGPYLVGLGLISAVRKPFQAYLLLTLYNIMFLTPLIVILVSVLAFGSLTRKVKAFRSTELGSMELISGSLLVAVCVYILLS